MSNQITKKSMPTYIFFLTTLGALLLPDRPAYAHDAPTLTPTRLDFDATSAPKPCHDKAEFQNILATWVPAGVIRADAVRRLKVRSRRSPTGGKLVDVTVEDAACW